MEEFTRFLTVADLGNVSRAADSLNLSQPALSRTMALLEQRFRTQLFHRGPGGVVLTGSGRILYDHASRALHLLRDAGERIDYEGIGGHLSLRICAGDSWGNVVLPGILCRFRQAHPEIRVRLDIIGSEMRMSGLSAGEYDLSYGISLPRHERLGKVCFEPMLNAPYAVYCAADHPLRRGRRAPTEAVLRRYGWVKHKFEYDHDPAQWQASGRDYVATTNTMLSTLEIVLQSDLLMSTSELFAPLFERHGLHRLAPDPISPNHVSGLHRLATDSPASSARLFDELCRRCCVASFPKFRIEDERKGSGKGAAVLGTEPSSVR